jgi:endonuclease/exonuclease/phosphatase family metal-dependent hydrolase
MRVLSWNLYHGRDFPPEPALFTLRSRLRGVSEIGETHVQVNRPLLDEFAGVLERLEWDVALLQEAPPRWFAPLAARTRSSGVRVLTSRNWLPALQARLADLNPDLIASGEGGSNQILVRHPGRVLEHRRLTLAFWPERRRMHWARLDLPGFGRVCVANLHATAGRPERASVEVVAAGQASTQFSADDPLVLGGDFNLRPALQPAPFA